MAFLPGRFQSAEASPDNGFAATIVPMDSAEHFTAVTANNNLCKAVVAAVTAFFTIGAGLDHSPAYQFFLNSHVNIFWNNRFVVAFNIILRNNAGVLLFETI